MKLLSILLIVVFSLGCGGYQSSSGMRPASTPNISALAPSTATAGSDAFVLMVNGTGFASNSVVYWNSASLPTTYMSAELLTANISAADVANAGTVPVFVKNQGTGIYAMGVNSNSVGFTVH